MVRNRETKIMPKQIKLGVVGCGYWGPNLVRNFRSLLDCQLKMMCDISKDPEHLTSLYPEVDDPVLEATHPLENRRH